MTTVSPKKGHDPSRVNEISAKLMENPDLAKLIGALSTSTDDASDLVKGLLQASINAGLQAEMDTHLGYAHSDRNAKARVDDVDGANHRNGSYTKTVGTGYSPVGTTVPRDRAGTFRPVMVPKGARRLTELDDMIVSLYAGGMTVRDIQHHLSTTLGVDMSPDMFSTIADAVFDEVMLWQNRQLDEFYPAIFLDALRVKIRDGGYRVVNKACFMAVGIDMDGIKHIPGLWIADTEGAAFWPSVCTDLANRGVNDVFIVCCDGLKGLPKAVEATWPNSMVQTCTVHLIRVANRWVSYQDRKRVSSALRQVYTVAMEDTARAAHDAFEASELGAKYPQSVKVWRARRVGTVRAVFAVPACRVLYTTNAIESLNAELGKATRNRGQFPSDTAALKTLWLMICNIEDKRGAQRAKRAKREIDRNGYIEGVKATGWKQAINQLSVAYPS